MILGEAALAMRPAHGVSGITIDDIFRRQAQRRPDALALVDAANRESFTDGEPRRLTYADADLMVAAIAGRLRHMGLPTDAIVGIQLPNIVENILAMLGVLRAGMIVAPLPLLWRRVDAAAALAGVGAKALITCGRVGAFHHGQAAATVAADVFSIRYVCGFGKGLPDGLVAFDDLFAAREVDAIPSLERDRLSEASAHVAAITYDVAEGGVVPVARNHAELLAGGLPVLLEGRVAQDSTILSTVAPSSFAGICMTLLPWLVCGGTLVLHHPFDPGTLTRQLRDDGCGTLILPGPVAFLLSEAHAFAPQKPATVIAAWRAPERLESSAAWDEPAIALVDVPIFGEAALAPARRDGGGRPSPIPLGPILAPRGSADATVVGELTRTAAGTLAVRGPMVPHHAFPPGIERSGLPCFKIGDDGFVDCGYACRIDTDTQSIVLTGPPAGMVSVGGYRFALNGLRDVVGRIDHAAMLAALPDPIVGQRFIGNATDRGTMRAALDAFGINPLVTAAFCDRSDGAAEADSAIALTRR